MFSKSTINFIGIKPLIKCLECPAQRSTGDALASSSNIPAEYQSLSRRALTIATANKNKTYHDIPGARGSLVAALDLMRSGGPGYLHEHCDRRHSQLGPIFRERLGSLEYVFIADTKMIQTVVANEGSQPHHSVPEAWTLYNKINNIERGLFFQVGEPWARLRRIFNKVMLADANKITRFTGEILKINSNLFNVWQQGASYSNNLSTGESFVIDDIKFELCKWSIEATGLMLFGCRMGCIPFELQERSDSRAAKLVRHVANMFAETSNFHVLPPRLAQRFNLGPWKRFKEASDGMIGLASDYASEFIRRARESDDNPSLLKDLLDLNAMDDAEISRSMVDLIIAAADTTSNSLQWMLWNLAKYPRVQRAIREEVESLGDLEAFMNIKQTCPYLGAFVKEVSRLYPTAPFLARFLDHPISLDGYPLPANVPIAFSLYTTSRMPEYFEDPLVFKPERWLRGDAKSHDQTKHAYASLPFGIGKRMCIGRRLADLEMHLLIASFVLKFDAFLADGCDDLKIKLKMILCPDRPITLRLAARD